MGAIGEVRLKPRSGRGGLDRRSPWLTVFKALKMSRDTAPTYFLVSRALYHLSRQWKRRVWVEWEGGIQTEEGRAGCGSGEVVKAGYERASRELCWEPGEVR